MNDKSFSSTYNKKQEKFVIFAERRVNNAIKSIRNIGNLSNKSAYEYQDHQIRQIMSALRSSIKDIESKFSKKGTNDIDSFKLR